MEKRIKEAIRYLGYKKCAVDNQMMQLILNTSQELEQLAEPRFIYRIFELSFPDSNTVQIGHLKIESQSLCTNLSGCEKSILFAATLGIEIDRQMRKYERIDMTKAVVWQALAASYIEEYLDAKQEELSRLYVEEANILRPRFSPGYGDFSILHQKDVLDMLDATKQIGIALTDGYMLTPTKSVTAVIGICRAKEKGTEICYQKD